MSTSYIRVHDHFCGMGGNTQGVVEAGAEVELAINHKLLACETYAANHPRTDVIQTDLLNADPRQFRGADVLIASPECTKHSPASGKKRLSKQWRLWEDDDEPEDAESVNGQGAGYFKSP